MSTVDAGKMREELALQEAIKRQADAVVVLANEAISRLSANTQLQKSQFSNLLSVAQSSQSVEVLVSYLRYQMGRKQNPWGTEKDDIAHIIIRHMHGALHHYAQAIATQVPMSNADENKEHRIQRIHFRLVHQYIGYLRRAFVYGKKVGFEKLDMQKESAKP